MLAIAKHNDAKNEFGGENMITEAGGPLNFTIKLFELSHAKQFSYAYKEPI